MAATDGDEVRAGFASSPASAVRSGASFLAPEIAISPLKSSLHSSENAPASPVRQSARKAGRLPQVEADRVLVEQCLAGDSAAWSQLYRQFHDRLLASIRPILGSLASDATLVDEIGARVWYSLVKNDFELLGRFDASRGCQLSTFLGIIAKREAKQLLRSERRRRVREQGASRRNVSSAEVRGDPNAEQEFLATLTPSERAFYTEFLLGPPETARATAYTPSNVWQLTHRVKEKLNAFLFGGNAP